MKLSLCALTRQSELQKNLHKEIHEALLECNGHLSYEKVSSLEYLSMVVDETLLLYSILLLFLDLQCKLLLKERLKINLKPFHH